MRRILCALNSQHHDTRVQTAILGLGYSPPVAVVEHRRWFQHGGVVQQNLLLLKRRDGNDVRGKRKSVRGNSIKRMQRPLRSPKRQQVQKESSRPKRFEEAATTKGDTLKASKKGADGERSAKKLLDRLAQWMSNNVSGEMFSALCSETPQPGCVHIAIEMLTPRAGHGTRSGRPLYGVSICKHDGGRLTPSDLTGLAVTTACPNEAAEPPTAADVDDPFDGLLSASDLSTVALPSVPTATSHRIFTMGTTSCSSEGSLVSRNTTKHLPMENHSPEQRLLADVQSALSRRYPWHANAVKVDCQFSRIDTNEEDKIGQEGHQEVVVASVTLSLPCDDSRATAADQQTNADDAPPRLTTPVGTQGTTVYNGEGAGVNDLEALVEALLDAFSEANMHGEVPECVHHARRVLCAEGADAEGATGNTTPTASSSSAATGTSCAAALEHSVAGRLWNVLTTLLAQNPPKDAAGVALTFPVLSISGLSVPTPQNPNIRFIPPLGVSLPPPSSSPVELQLCVAPSQEDALSGSPSTLKMLASVQLTVSTLEEEGGGAVVFPSLPREYLRCLDTAMRALDGDDSSSSSSRTPSPAAPSSSASLTSILLDMPCVVPMAERLSLNRVVKNISAHYLGDRRALEHVTELAPNASTKVSTWLWLPFCASSLAERAKDEWYGNKRRGACPGYLLPIANGPPAATNSDARDAALHVLLYPSRSRPCPFPEEVHGQLASPSFMLSRSFTRTASSPAPRYERGILTQLRWVAAELGFAVDVRSTLLRTRGENGTLVTCWRTRVFTKPAQRSTSVELETQNVTLRAEAMDFKRVHSVLRACLAVLTQPTYADRMAPQTLERFQADLTTVPTSSSFLQSATWEEVSVMSSNEAAQRNPSAPPRVLELEALPLNTKVQIEWLRGPSLNIILQRAVAEVVADQDFKEFVARTLASSEGNNTISTYLPELSLKHRSSFMDDESGGTRCSGHVQIELIVSVPLSHGGRDVASSTLKVVELLSVETCTTEHNDDKDDDEIATSEQPSVACLHAQHNDPSSEIIWHSDEPGSNPWPMRHKLFALGTLMEAFSVPVPAIRRWSRQCPQNNNNNAGQRECSIDAIRTRFWSAVRAAANDAAAFCLIPTPDFPSKSSLCGASSADYTLPYALTDVPLLQGGAQAHPLELVAALTMKTLGCYVATEMREAEPEVPSDAMPSEGTDPPIPFTVTMSIAEPQLGGGTPGEEGIVWHPVVRCAGQTKSSAGLAACTALLERLVLPISSLCCTASSVAHPNDQSNTTKTPNGDALQPSCSSVEQLVLTIPPLEPSSLGAKVLRVVHRELEASLASCDQTQQQNMCIETIEGVRCGVLYDHSTSAASFLPFLELEYTTVSAAAKEEGGCAAPERPSTNTRQRLVFTGVPSSPSIFTALSSMWTALSRLNSATLDGTEVCRPITSFSSPFPEDKFAHSSCGICELMARHNTRARVAGSIGNVLSGFTPPRVLQQTTPQQLLDMYAKKMFGVPVLAHSSIIPRTTEWKTVLSVEVVVSRPATAPVPTTPLPYRAIPPSSARPSNSGEAGENDTMGEESPPQQQLCQLIVASAQGTSKKHSYKLAAVPLLRHEIAGAIGAAAAPPAVIWDADHFSLLLCEGTTTTANEHVRLLWDGRK